MWKEGTKRQKQSAIIFIVIFAIQLTVDLCKYRGWTTVTVPNESFPSNESMASTTNVGFLLFMIPLYLISQFNFKIALKNTKGEC